MVLVSFWLVLFCLVEVVYFSERSDFLLSLFLIVFFGESKIFMWLLFSFFLKWLRKVMNMIENVYIFVVLSVFFGRFLNYIFLGLVYRFSIL